jgi:hypothetical protein
MATLSDRITAANAEVIRRMTTAAPVLCGVRTARDVIPALSGRTLLHAGPPIAPPALCGPMRGAMLGAARLEGWAATPEAAAAMLDAGAITLSCAHDHGAVGPMAGVIAPSMPVLEVRDDVHGRQAFCPLNEGIGAVLRFGAYGDDVIARLRWMAEVLGPALERALRRLDGVPLIPLMARALAMGDEMHQRNIAATALLTRALAPALVGAGELPAGELAGVMRFLADNDQFFLNVAMAAAKCIMEAAGEVPHATVVSAMSRNGVEFGIRVSGLLRRWFTAPAPVPHGLYFPGHSAEHANADMGDSAIVETVGLGGFAMAAAPAVVGFVGLGSAQEALRITQRMGEITVAQSPHFLIPALDFQGVPTGIDIRRVVELEVTPVINTGIAHQRAGVGQIGAGVVRAPLECFQQALAAFAEHYAI